jgi:hypothetical protein
VFCDTQQRGRDHFCGLVVRVLGYRSRVPVSITGATKFSEKKWVWNGVHSVSTIEELRERKSKGSGLKKRDYSRRGSAALTKRHDSPQKLALTSPTRGGRSAGIVRSRTQATEFVCCWFFLRHQILLKKIVWLLRSYTYSCKKERNKWEKRFFWRTFQRSRSWQVLFNSVTWRRVGVLELCCQFNAVR